jgi:hypothetical protein
MTDGLIDRFEYCKAVEIDKSTLSGWVRDGIVTPVLGGSRGTKHLFSPDDVRRGRGLIAMLKQHHGKYSRREMVEIIDSHRELKDGNNPAARDP